MLSFIYPSTESPSAPVLLMPDSLVADQEPEAPIWCTAHLGFPPGEIRWLIKPKGAQIITNIGNLNAFYTSLHFFTSLARLSNLFE